MFAQGCAEFSCQRALAFSAIYHCINTHKHKHFYDSWAESNAPHNYICVCLPVLL